MSNIKCTCGNPECPGYVTDPKTTIEATDDYNKMDVESITGGIFPNSPQHFGVSFNEEKTIYIFDRTTLAMLHDAIQSGFAEIEINSNLRNPN